MNFVQVMRKSLVHALSEGGEWCDLKKRKSDKLPVSSEGGFESTGRGVPFGHTQSGMHNANR